MKDITNCPNCGAPLPLNGICQYCGTEIIRDSYGNLSYRIVNCNVRPVMAEAAVSMELIAHADPEDITRMLHRDLAIKLAEEIMKEAVIEVYDDQRTMEKHVRARVLVADGKQYSRFLQTALTEEETNE